MGHYVSPLKVHKRTFYNIGGMRKKLPISVQLSQNNLKNKNRSTPQDTPMEGTVKIDIS